MKHIAIDARIINSSTGTYVQKLLEYLQQEDKKNKYTIIVLEKDKDFWQPVNKNFSVKTVGFKNYSLSEQIGFKSFLDKLSPDLVHFCMPQQPILYSGKKVTSFHDLTLLKTYNSDKNWLIYHTKQILGKFVFSRVLKNNNRIIVPSKYTKKDMLSFFPKTDTNKITLIYDAAEYTSLKCKKFNHNFKKFILYVGQQSDYKNIRRLGAAHQKLLKKHPNLGLILVGRKNKAALANEAFFKDKKYKNILFTDFIPDSQRDYLYQTAGAYVFPSLMEGFGLPGLEAMCHNLPVISSSATCLPEVYQDGAVYFNPLDTDDMAQKIAEVLSDKSLRESLVKKANKVLKQYSWKKTAKETLAVYEEVLN